MHLVRECQPFSLSRPLFDALTASLSPARMAPYLADAHNCPSLAFRRYRWNLLLTESLGIPLHFSEVFLRNAIYETIRRNLGRQWLSSRDSSLTKKTKQIIEEGEKKIEKQNISNGKNPTPTQGQVIAEMTFGFWHNMAKPAYHQLFWRGTLGGSFPHAPSTTTLVDLYDAMTRLRDARNRIAHHEHVIWKNPAQIYADCMALIEWTAGEGIGKIIDEEICSFRIVMASRPT